MQGKTFGYGPYPTKHLLVHWHPMFLFLVDSKKALMAPNLDIISSEVKPKPHHISPIIGNEKNSDKGLQMATSKNLLVKV
jgi:hypothetical protein